MDFVVATASTSCVL